MSNANQETISVMWLSPNLNHYKKHFLNNLSQSGGVKLHFIGGKMYLRGGYIEDDIPTLFETSFVNVSKKYYPFSLKVFFEVGKICLRKRIDIVVLPVGKKFFFLILWMRLIKIFHGYRLTSYCHSFIKHNTKTGKRLEVKRSKKFYKMFDAIIFYTQGSKIRAIEKGVIAEDKAFFANNTLDTKRISAGHLFKVNVNKPLNILFIARLVKNKQIDLLLEYFSRLEMLCPDIELSVIGNGPEAVKIRAAQAENSKISWHGAIVNEKEIAEHMERAHVVFVPGESGLSVIHAFAYGKPYITLDLPNLMHGPETDYLNDDVNGLFLSGDFESNIGRIVKLLSAPQLYKEMCVAARQSAEEYTLENWTSQIKANFKCILKQ